MPLITEIDDQYLDIDFTKEQYYTFGDLGCPLFFGNSYEDLYGVLSDSEIEAEMEKTAATGGGLERLVTRIYDQGNEGSCVANASCQAHEVLQAVQNGKENVVHLSAISLYKRIGSSPNSGAMVSDGWAELNRRGALPLDTPENRAKYGAAVMPNTGFSRKMPANWEDTAILFSGFEATIIRTFQGMKSALAIPDGPVVVGRQGHSICYVGMVKSGGTWKAPYPNSWSENWGAAYGYMPGGFGFDTIRQIQMSSQYAWKLRAIRA
jgi:hypothetical protein